MGRVLERRTRSQLKKMSSPGTKDQPIDLTVSDTEEDGKEDRSATLPVEFIDIRSDKKNMQTDEQRSFRMTRKRQREGAGPQTPTFARKLQRKAEAARKRQQEQEEQQQRKAEAVEIFSELPDIVPNFGKDLNDTGLRISEQQPKNEIVLHTWSCLSPPKMIPRIPSMIDVEREELALFVDEN